MATIGDRAATWTNSDGLVVGYGTNDPAQAGGVEASGKKASVTFDWQDLNACYGAGGTVNVPVPAGSRVLDVRVLVHKTLTSTGTNTFEVGLTGGDVDGYITVAAATNAAALLNAGAVVLADGVFTYDDTADGDTTAAELKIFAAADTIDIVTGMADWTGGSATLEVTYL